MNAESQAITLEITSKIAYLAVLFRAEFPRVEADLQPWLTDAYTQDQLDPHSIDLSFFFPSAVQSWDVAACCYRCISLRY